MIYKIYITFAVCVLFGLPSTLAQQKLTLQDAVELALKNNFDIKLMKNQVAIAKNNNNLGNAGILPVAAATFNTGGSRQNTVQTQSTGTERRINGARNSNMGYGVGLDWTIFDGFAMFANQEKLKAMELQSGQSSTQQVYNTLTDVFTAYYNLSKQQQLVTSSDSTLDVSALRLKIADSKLKIGRGSKLDLLAAQVDYNTDTATYILQKNVQNNFMVALNNLLGRDINIKFTVDNSFTVEDNLNYTELSSQLEKLNPTFKNALLSKKIAELNLKQVKGNRYPQINVNSGYDFNRSESPTGFNTKFKSNGLSYGLTASLNIFNGFLQRQNERNAKIEIDNSTLQIEKTRLDLSAQLTKSFQDYQTFLELIKLEENNLKIAHQNLDITLEKYRLGNITPLELREAQKNAIEANNRYLETKFQGKLSEIYLKQISGTLNLQ